jgi:Domain of unknown function (DUF1844)
MATEEPESAFKVTDRRRRGDDEPQRASEPRRDPAPTGRTAPPPQPSDPGGSLVGLFMMLGSSALMAMGETDPTTGQRGQRDLPMAAEVIDVLALLRDRTEGRRSTEESQVLDELLYDLQLRYVDATKRPG